MEDPDSSLRVSLEWLCRILHSETGVIFLREYDKNDEHCVSFTNHTVRWMTAAEPDATLLSHARSACERRQTQNQNGILSFVLTCEEAEAFGGISFLNGNISNPERLNKALLLFSRAVYHQLLAGIQEEDNIDPVMLRGENICMNYSADGLQPNTVDKVSFWIHRGQFTIIMGRSGSGKSTLLNIIGGMLTPTQGSLWWNGDNIADFNQKQKTAYRREKLGFIFQNYNLVNDLTAIENVEVAVSLVKNADSAEQILRQVGLGEKLSSYPTHMSGGEQQRVSIARALVKRPEILLCDEPTGALDTENAKNIMILLQRIARQRKIAVIMVTHNPEFIPLADHFIEMENGKIKKDIYQPFPFAAEDLL